jgi:hypothetical protein
VQILLRDLIEPEPHKHDGRLVNTAGDALLLEFTSTTAAVRCAVAVQRRVPEFDGDLPPCRPTGASAFASASISATCLQTARIFTAVA